LLFASSCTSGAEDALALLGLGWLADAAVTFGVDPPTFVSMVVPSGLFFVLGWMSFVTDALALLGAFVLLSAVDLIWLIAPLVVPPTVVVLPTDLGWLVGAAVTFGVDPAIFVSIGVPSGLFFAPSWIAFVADVVKLPSGPVLLGAVGLASLFALLAVPPVFDPTLPVFGCFAGEIEIA
jgi:hypothetical protein